MYDHIGLQVKDLEKSIRFFEAVLAPLGGAITSRDTTYAGLFKTLNHERNDVMHGLERYFRKQREFSEQIRSTILQLRELQDGPNPDRSRVDELTNRVGWDKRIFEERRKTINFVCEVPVMIEQRLFALARTIQQSLE